MSDQEEEHTIAEESVVNKYSTAGDVVNRVAQKIAVECVDGASVRTLCVAGDKLMESELKGTYRKEKDISKGIAFPLAISVNNCINHFSPLFSDKDVELKNGDVVKLDLGVHIDEFIAVLGHTLIVGANSDSKVTGRKADVTLAAYNALQAAIRLVKPGNDNHTVTEAIHKISGNYNCKPVEGTCSYQLQQGRIEGDKGIILTQSDAQKRTEKVEFKANEVYAVDVVVSTGAGKGREMETRTTIYKKNDDVYNLKLKTSREFFRAVQKTYSSMPFNLRYFEDEKKAKLGVVECSNHRLVEPFAVMFEKETELVAQFKSTILLLPNSIKCVTGLPFDADLYESTCTIEDEDLKKLVISDLPSSSKAKKRRAKKKLQKQEDAKADDEK